MIATCTRSPTVSGKKYKKIHRDGEINIPLDQPKETSWTRLFLTTKLKYKTHI